MSENTTKRTRRTFEQVKADNIAKMRAKIAELEAEKLELEKAIKEEEARQPKVRAKSDKTKIKSIVDIAAKVGKTPEDIAKALGIDIPDEMK